jgi:N-acetyl sugar amidotransferase
MKFCTKCLYPDTKPHLSFDDYGVCAACNSYINRSLIDWKSRKKELLNILDKYRKSDEYDCIVPVSGGKDSTYQVLQAINLGMNPLAVVVETCDLSDIGKRNIENIKNIGVDVIQYSTSKKVRATLNRAGLELVGDISWPEHVSIFTVPAQIAVRFNIPLILWGECGQNEYGGPAASQQNNTLDRNWMEEFALVGLRVDDMIGFNNIEIKNLSMFVYPDDDKINAIGVTGVFLGYYLPWDGYNNKLIAQANGFESYGRPVEGHFVDYENLDNHQAGLHEYLMYLKFGYGRATSQACIDIRRGRVSREDAAKAVVKLEGMYPQSFLGKKLTDVLGHIEMTQSQFDVICEQFTNYELFELDQEGNLARNLDGSPIRKFFP